MKHKASLCAIDLPFLLLILVLPFLIIDDFAVMIVAQTSFKSAVEDQISGYFILIPLQTFLCFNAISGLLAHSEDSPLMSPEASTCAEAARRCRQISSKEPYTLHKIPIRKSSDDHTQEDIC